MISCPPEPLKFFPKSSTLHFKFISIRFARHGPAKLGRDWTRSLVQPAEYPPSGSAARVVLIVQVAAAAVRLRRWALSGRSGGGRRIKGADLTLIVVTVPSAGGLWPRSDHQ